MMISRTKHENTSLQGEFLIDRDREIPTSREAPLSLASAMHHLDKTRVIIQVLKPENRGFDDNSTARLFDFELAHEIVEHYGRMTICTSLLHYTAPENVRSSNYGSPVNAYSFGVLLCEIMALEQPVIGMAPRIFLHAMVTLGV